MLLRVQFGKEQKYVKLSELTFNAFLKEGASQLSSCSGTSDDTVILNYKLCDPVEEEAAAKGSQPKRPRHINYEAKARKEVPQSANLQKLVGQVVFVSPPPLTESHLKRMWEQLLLF
ncbi:hypothetical protein HF521_018079 [Silurus meridionalis]|uniref:Uncharacterized protein n=1 Tax=Silurus meridionalis TaxID=175797 RepID=A0A8T0BNZ7_SILME|nr:hypothetical protein HF521_018079 [Silurus meridionalis]